MIYSISGFDGAGKTTQLEYLRAWFEGNGKKTGSIFDLSNEETYSSQACYKKYLDYFEDLDVIFTRFYLRSAKTQELLHKMLFNPNNIFLDKELAFQAFLSCKDDAEKWYTNVIHKQIMKNKIVVFDRYFYDEALYRSLYSLNLNNLLDEYNNSIIPIPDYSFYLKLPLETVIERNSTREDAKTTLFKNKNKLSELNSKFDLLSENNNWKVIDAELTREEILNVILDTLKIS